MHQNSLEAHTIERDSGRLSRREQAIMEYFTNITSLYSSTDRHVCTFLGFTDMNSVRPRITTLIKRGLLEECGSMRDPLTGKRVRLVRLKQGQGKLF